MRGPLDIVCLTGSLWPDTDVFSGKTLTLGGSRRLETTGGRAQEGDLSAILIENTPWLAGRMRVPKPETALIPDFEKKVEAICRETVGQNVTAFAGVPSWNLVMLRKVLEFTGKSNLLEVWPRLELFTHGGMNFKPYREQYRAAHSVRQDEIHGNLQRIGGLLRHTERSGVGRPAADARLRRVLRVLAGARFGRSVPGSAARGGRQGDQLRDDHHDLQRPVALPDRRHGRVHVARSVQDPDHRAHAHYINAFGEEVIVDNAETALKAACDATGARISDYTAGPVYMNGRSKGSHQWVVEFDTPPDDAERFTDTLDRALQSVNSDYEAKRFKDTTLMRPTLTVVPPGTFYRWMKSRGKAGGQNKVPRLFNDRTYIDQLTADERSNDPK